MLSCSSGVTRTDGLGNRDIRGTAPGRCLGDEAIEVDCEGLDSEYTGRRTLGLPGRGPRGRPER